MNEIKLKPFEDSEIDVCSNNCKNYKLLCEVGSGTYGRVFKALCLKTNSNVALKKIDISKQDMEGFPITAIREIKLLKMLDHPNIIKLREIVVSKPSSNNKNRGSTFLVFDYMDHDFVGLKNIKMDFTLPQIKCIIFQILQGVKYLHEKKILHRDLKSANILFNNQGEVKIADFGLARQISLHPQMLYTNKVVTLWYRAPEILLGSQEYGPAVDIWSVGCILVELITGEVLFPGDKEAKQIELIYDRCGTPDILSWSEVEKFKYYNELKPKMYRERKLKQYIRKKKDLDESTLDLIDKLLILNPKFRITADEALIHECFQRNPLPCTLEEMPKIDRECHEGMFKDKMKKIGMMQNLQRIKAFQEIPTNFNDNNFFINARSNQPDFNQKNNNFQQKKRKNEDDFPKKKAQYEDDDDKDNEHNFLLSEKDHDLHFQSDHSPQIQSKSPNYQQTNESESNVNTVNTLNEPNAERKENLDFFKSGIGLKSLISSNKSSSPQLLLKKEISIFSEKGKMNELDKLFMPNYQEKNQNANNNTQKKKVKREKKKNFKEDLIEDIKKKVKTEEKS